MSEVLARTRDAALFYLKLDFALAAGVASLASLVKLEPEQLLSSAATFRHTLQAIGLLIVLAMLIEFVVTNGLNMLSSNKEMSAKEKKYTSLMVSVGYSVLVFGHLVLIAYLSGFVGGYLDSAASHAPIN